MQWNEAESRVGKYDVYYTEDGTRLVVIEGLNKESEVALYPMQEALLPHVDTIIVLYWALIVTVVAYLLGMYIVVPLSKRIKR